MTQTWISILLNINQLNLARLLLPHYLIKLSAVLHQELALKEMINSRPRYIVKSRKILNQTFTTILLKRLYSLTPFHIYLRLIQLVRKSFVHSTKDFLALCRTSKALREIEVYFLQNDAFFFCTHITRFKLCLIYRINLGYCNEVNIPSFILRIPLNFFSSAIETQKTTEHFYLTHICV